MDNQKKVKAKKTNKFTYHFKSVLLIAVSGWFIFNVGNEVLTAKQLKEDLSAAQVLADEIKEERKSLEKQKEMLQDPDYAMNYARGKLLISQDGEQIFSLEDDE